MRQVIDLVLGNPESIGKDLDIPWFAVRNPLKIDVESHSLLEEKLFTSAPWAKLPASKRGTAALKQRLSALLCSALRDSFPGIRATLGSQIERLQAERQGLGEAKTTYRERWNWLSSIVGEYEKLVSTALESPGKMPSEATAVRRWATEINEDFAAFMRSHGESYRFEYEDVEPRELLQEAQQWWDHKFQGWRSVSILSSFGPFPRYQYEIGMLMWPLPAGLLAVNFVLPILAKTGSSPEEEAKSTGPSPRTSYRDEVV